MAFPSTSANDDEIPAEAFPLAEGTWYGWWMVPGYLEGEYVSAILMRRVRPVPGRPDLIEISFRDARHAQGVPDFEGTIEVSLLGSRALLCTFDDAQGKEHCGAISILDEDKRREVQLELARTKPPGEDSQVFLRRVVGGA